MSYVEIDIWRRFRIEVSSRLAERRAAKALAPEITYWSFWLSPQRREDRRVRQFLFRHVRAFHNCEPS